VVTESSVFWDVTPCRPLKLPDVSEEHTVSILRVFENRVLRRIFGSKGDEVTGEWRKLHDEELRDLYSSLSVI
jgi:hypothetical protein